jgi:hypothetical protein
MTCLCSLVIVNRKIYLNDKEKPESCERKNIAKQMASHPGYMALSGKML